MSWNTLLAHWPSLLAPLCLRFRHFDLTAVARFRGDRAKLEAYLAETHDLTLPEAAEALDDWLDLEAPKALMPVAA